MLLHLTVLWEFVCVYSMLLHLTVLLEYVNSLFVTFHCFVRISILDAVTFYCFVRIGILGSCYISLFCENRYKRADWWAKRERPIKVSIVNISAAAAFLLPQTSSSMPSTLIMKQTNSLWQFRIFEIEKATLSLSLSLLLIVRLPISMIAFYCYFGYLKW